MEEFKRELRSVESRELKIEDKCLGCPGLDQLAEDLAIENLTNQMFEELAFENDGQRVSEQLGAIDRRRDGIVQLAQEEMRQCEGVHKLVAYAPNGQPSVAGYVCGRSVDMAKQSGKEIKTKALVFHDKETDT